MFILNLFKPITLNALKGYKVFPKNSPPNSDREAYLFTTSFCSIFTIPFQSRFSLPAGYFLELNNIFLLLSEKPIFPLVVNICIYCLILLSEQPPFQYISADTVAKNRGSATFSSIDNSVQKSKIKPYCYNFVNAKLVFYQLLLRYKYKTYFI